MRYTDDPASDAEAYIADQEYQMSRYPVCDCCGEHMYEGYELEDGTLICDECMKGFHKDFEPDDTSPAEYWG